MINLHRIVFALSQITLNKRIKDIIPTEKTTKLINAFEQAKINTLAGITNVSKKDTKFALTLDDVLDAKELELQKLINQILSD